MSTVALLLWLVLQVPVIWLGNPSGAFLVMTLMNWGVWAAGVAAAVLPRADLPVIALVGVGVSVLIFFGGFAFLGLLFPPAIAASLALWLHWREPRSARGGTPS